MAVEFSELSSHIFFSIDKLMKKKNSIIVFQVSQKYDTALKNDMHQPTCMRSYNTPAEAKRICGKNGQGKKKIEKTWKLFGICLLNSPIPSKLHWIGSAI